MFNDGPSEPLGFNTKKPEGTPQRVPSSYSQDRSYVTIADIERLIDMGIRVFLEGGQEVRRVTALPAVTTPCDLAGEQC